MSYKRSILLLYVTVFFLSMQYFFPLSVFARQITYPADNPLFAVPEGLQVNVDFWKKVYTKYTTDHIIIYDDNNLDIIYDVIDMKKDFPSFLVTERKKRRKAKELKKKYIRMVKKIGKSKKNRLTEREKQIHTMLKAHYSKKQIRRAYKHIRIQVAQQDRFLEGLKKSGLYIDKMKAIFTSFGLPVELTVLPHVESSFNYNAYSRFGAAGVWQFTRSTGRKFMKIGYEIDERRDPIFSTVAAAKLLKENYEKLGNWPLAVTAYNHGSYGMKRAQRTVGNDIVEIIHTYKSRIFGFASKNFYAEFLAALDIMRDYTTYFGQVEISDPLQYDIFKLEHYVDIDTLVKYMNMSKDEVHFFNPSLRPSILKSNKLVPKGFNLKISKGNLEQAVLAYAQIPSKEKFSKQKRSQWYRVRRGDTLIRIAHRFRTTVGDLKKLNLLRNSHMIYSGQTLQIPPLSSHAVASKSPVIPKRENIPDRYKVKRGDTLSTIARRFGMSIHQLQEINRIKNSNLLEKGQLLYFAKKEERVKETPVVKQAVNNEVKGEQKKERQQLSTTVDGKIFVSAAEKTDFSPWRRRGENDLLKLIRVEPGETLGHYSDWSNLPVWRLRRLNGLSFRQQIHIGQDVRISFENSSLENFETKRKEFHKGVEEDFFSAFSIEKIVPYTLAKGDTLWDICADNQIPYWLLLRYNSDKDLSNLIVGEILAVPVVFETK